MHTRIIIATITINTRDHSLTVVQSGYLTFNTASDSWSILITSIVVVHRSIKIDTRTDNHNASYCTAVASCVEHLMSAVHFATFITIIVIIRRVALAIIFLVIGYKFFSSMQFHSRLLCQPPAGSRHRTFFMSPLDCSGQIQRPYIRLESIDVACITSIRRNALVTCQFEPCARSSPSVKIGHTAATQLAERQVSRSDSLVINWAIAELVTMTDRRVGNVA